ncbi:MAG: hypothetical protein GOMPHAMPRED_000568 [Gomphillus americanus]|uniref:Patatin-like phospholipase domain-containing protein n=1 Tax=Gomphillus americanus TaxID=1940652 RepID=A0A8H3I595_9LECA|nr:MAG: hypothetical protein GOMPHAMPRED_000568 [Gomphillus americanus]
MADIAKKTNGPSPDQPEAFDPWTLPDYQYQFVEQQDLEAFAQALHDPESNLVTALNDWKPIQQRVQKRGSKGKRRKSRRGKDETREGFVYSILKWPLLIGALAWIAGLCAAYLLTRLYIWLYEHLFTWTGERERLRQSLRSKTNYADWIQAAKQLDAYLGTELWKSDDDYAYYDHKTVGRVKRQLKSLREQIQNCADDGVIQKRATEELKALIEACAKSNFAGTENPRIYSETYYGTKNLIQEYIDELEESLKFLLKSSLLDVDEKYRLAKHMHTNLGRTALCLSGGAAFAYYHFGVVKALLDSDLLPDIITGTSGGALVASLVGTRTNEELKKLLVPALAYQITASEEPVTIWLRRWWKTGARFDSIDWARKCSWFTMGSLTFKEAYERTGRILNITCIPSDPHSPTILANYLTAPNCVIWSAVLASAAVPGILNPVVLMTKTRSGTLAPYSFGHKWKDGSLRTDIPLRALNLHFNVNFSIVSQVNPHINLFFFSSRGTVGRPVTHRRGRGWRGGFLGSALEQYIKLDLTKWLKVLRRLELLPRPMGQDWSEIWLQPFNGTITIWPRSKLPDFVHILSDPSPTRLARMLQVGQSSTFPKLLFIANRIKIERLIEQGLLAGKSSYHSASRDSMHIQGQARRNTLSGGGLFEDGEDLTAAINRNYGKSSALSIDGSNTPMSPRPAMSASEVVEELRRQSNVFFDDSDIDLDEEGGTDTDVSTTEDDMQIHHGGGGPAVKDALEAARLS